MEVRQAKLVEFLVLVKVNVERVLVLNWLCLGGLVKLQSGFWDLTPLCLRLLKSLADALKDRVGLLLFRDPSVQNQSSCFHDASGSG